MKDKREAATLQSESEKYVMQHVFIFFCAKHLKIRKRLSTFASCNQRRPAETFKQSAMKDELTKLKTQLAMIENAIRTSKRKQDLLGFDFQDEIDRLLDKWSDINKEIKKLEKQE